MSVSQVSAANNQVISTAKNDDTIKLPNLKIGNGIGVDLKNDDTIELPFDKAFENLSILANLKIGNWIGADLKNRKIIIWNYVSTWFYNPDTNIIELVSNSVKSVLNAMENNKVNRPKIICDHEKISKGFKTAVLTYKAYPDLSKKLEEISIHWDQNKPTQASLEKANKLLIWRTLKSVPRAIATQVTLFEKNPLFNKQRIKNETAVVPEGNYPRAVRERAASAVPFARKLSGEIKAIRRESSVLDRPDFCAALMLRRSKILGTSEKSE